MTQILRVGRRLIIGAVGASYAVLLVACGLINSAPGGDPGVGPATISITEPAEAAMVTQPFTLRVETSVELGPPESGKHHVHLTFDGREDDYTVEPDGTMTIDQLSPGPHTIKVTLRHADHSPTGAEAELTVTVSDGSESVPPSDPNSGYGY
ncbi:hypothetical protein [Microlunatus speluncae]|uniref:hypothetical protein n=1 Tax=Microlunatus speluncae TaxID=2594267 RepID=UPI00126688EA|nr:hypothetical protein [Microlunatus speluncae]